MNNKPVRIQRSRQFKQVSPNDLPIKYAGRPSAWGNPFKLVAGIIYVNVAHRRKILNPWVYLCEGDDDKLMQLYRSVVTGNLCAGGYGIAIDSFGDIMHWVNHFRKLDLSELKDKNLSCWCNLQRACHVDILLELVSNFANYFVNILYICVTNRE